MATAPRTRHLDVAYIAGRILNASCGKHPASLREELARARKVLPEIHPLGSLETERLEVLESAMDSLESPIRERTRAAIHLLEQLAGEDAAPLSRRSLPA